MIKIGTKNCLLYMSSLLVPIGVQAHLTEEKFQVKFENEQSRDAIISRYADYDFTRIIPKAGNEIIDFIVPADGNGDAVAFCEVYADEKDILLYRFKTSGYNPGESYSSSIPDDIVENISRIRLCAMDQWGNYSDFSEPITVSTDVPSTYLGNIYGINNFTVYRPSKAGTLETHPQSHLHSTLST